MSWVYNPATGEYDQWVPDIPQPGSPDYTGNNQPPPPVGPVIPGAETDLYPDPSPPVTPSTGGGSTTPPGAGHIDGIGDTIAAGSSITPAQRDRGIADALAAGVPGGWITDFIARNPNDYNRIVDGYFSDAGMEDTRLGTPNVTEGGGGSGGGGGGGTHRAPLDPPGPFVAPAYHAPVWNQPAPYVAPIFQEPEPWTYASFEKPTLEEAKNEPGYQFAMEEGARALEQSASAKGTLNTGGTLKDLIGYGQRLGELNYNNVFNRTHDTWETNKDLSKSIWDTDYGVRKDKFKYDTEGGLKQYQEGYAASQDLFNTQTHAAEAEYKPIYDSAYQSYLTSYNIWKELFDAAQELEQDND